MAVENQTPEVTGLKIKVEKFEDFEMTQRSYFLMGCNWKWLEKNFD